MLAKTKRLNLRLLDLSDFFSHSFKVNTHYFQAYLRFVDKNLAKKPLSDAKKATNNLKITVVVSKKVSLLAVERNALKRIVYNSLLAQYDELDLALKQADKNLQLAIFMKKKALTADKSDLTKQLKKLFQVIKDKNL